MTHSIFSIVHLHKKGISLKTSLLSTSHMCKDNKGKHDQPCPDGMDSCCPPSNPGVGEACYSSETEECCQTGPGKGHVCPKGSCSMVPGFICYKNLK